MRKSNQASGNGLPVAEAGFNLLVAHMLDHGKDKLHCAECSKTGDNGRHQSRYEDLGDHGAEVHTLNTRADDDGADQTAEQRVAARGRKAHQPGEQVPDNGADQTRQDELGGDGDHLLVDQTAGDGLCNLYGQKRADKVQRARGDNCGLGLERARRNGRCHRIGRIVETVREVKRQCGDDHQTDDYQRCRIHCFCSPFENYSASLKHRTLERLISRKDLTVSNVLLRRFKGAAHPRHAERKSRGAM